MTFLFQSTGAIRASSLSVVHTCALVILLLLPATVTLSPDPVKAIVFPLPVTPRKRLLAVPCSVALLIVTIWVELTFIKIGRASFRESVVIGVVVVADEVDTRRGRVDVAC